MNVLHQSPLVRINNFTLPLNHRTDIGELLINLGWIKECLLKEPDLKCQQIGIEQFVTTLNSQSCVNIDGSS